MSKLAITGVGGMRKFTLLSLNEGIVHFKLVLARPWEFNGFDSVPLSKVVKDYEVEI